jgi:hypothetical protein
MNHVTKKKLGSKAGLEDEVTATNLMRHGVVSVERDAECRSVFNNGPLESCTLNNGPLQ